MIIEQKHIDMLPDDEQMDFLENEHWIGVDHVEIIEDIEKNKTPTWVPQYLIERLKLSGKVVRFNADKQLVLHVTYERGERIGECTYVNTDGVQKKSHYHKGVLQGKIIKDIKIKRR